MKKPVLIAVAVAAAALTAAPALAKEMTLQQVCGTNGCHALKSAVRLGHEGFAAGITPAPEGYYVVKVGIGDGAKIFEHLNLYFAPKAGAVIGERGRGLSEGWAGIPAPAAEKLRLSAKGLKPFKAPRPSRVDLGGRRSVDPVPYASLLGPLHGTPIPEAYESTILISISWPGANPWSVGGSVLTYLPEARVVIRGDGYFAVPDSLAGRIDRERRGLPPVAPGGGFPWGVFAGALAGGLVLVTLAGALAVRRRRGPATERPVPA
jgi:hypothetical protein